MKSTHFIECKLVVRLQCIFLLVARNHFTIQNRLALDLETVIAEVILMVVEICSVCSELCSIMPALCFMLFIPYYAKSYADITDESLAGVHATISFFQYAWISEVLFEQILIQNAV